MVSEHTISLELLRSAVAWRGGILARSQRIPTSRADLDLVHWSTLEDTEAETNAAGGVGFTADQAEAAAIGEGLERYAAWTFGLSAYAKASLPAGAQWLDAESFSLYSEGQRAAGLRETMADAFTEVHRLGGGGSLCVPAALVALHPKYGGTATSSGLAAHTSLTHATLRATQELLERDALMSVWVWGLAPPRIEMRSELRDSVEARGGSVLAFDITQSWNPHRVVLVAGNLPLQGRARYAVGAACRASLDEAMEKAWLEWNQGTLFAGYFLQRNPTMRLRREEVTTFERHGAYYSVEPHEWSRLPLWGSGPRFSVAPVVAPAASSFSPPAESPAKPASEANSTTACLGDLVTHLRGSGVDLFGRELTTADVAQIGVKVMRVLSPQLVPIHVPHGAPYLGGTAANIAWRYGTLSERAMVSDFPHPLG